MSGPKLCPVMIICCATSLRGRLMAFYRAKRTEAEEQELLNVNFNYLTRHGISTFNASILFGFSAHMFIIVCCNVFISLSHYSLIYIYLSCLVK